MSSYVYVGRLLHAFASATQKYACGHEARELNQNQGQQHKRYVDKIGLQLALEHLEASLLIEGVQFGGHRRRGRAVRPVDAARHALHVAQLLDAHHKIGATRLRHLAARSLVRMRVPPRLLPVGVVRLATTLELCFFV